MTAKRPTLRLVGGSDIQPSAAGEQSCSRDRVHDRANMQTFLFRSYDLIVKSDEADLIRDVCLDIHKAEVKLKKVRQRLQGIQEQSAAQIRLLTAADTKLSAAIAAALLSTRKPSETLAARAAPSAEREQAYHDLLEAFGKLDSAGRRAVVSYLKTQATGDE
jgi:hypothetical protein